jgi:hypothetical protein
MKLAGQRIDTVVINLNGRLHNAENYITGIIKTQRTQSISILLLGISVLINGIAQLWHLFH